MAQAALANVLGYLRQACQGEADLSDGALLERFLTRREETAFALLVQRHGPLVLGVCRRVLGDFHGAEDCFQATFLVLVRRAASIRNKESLAGWLHAVAQRIAAKARAQAINRRQRERRSATMPQVSALDELSWQELRGVLDEELARLPQKYRIAIVLCHLQGKSHFQAAQELGWPRSSVASRLTRARELLRRQLARRGIVLATGAMAAALGDNCAQASVSARLTLDTVQMAVGVATGCPAAAGLLSARVAALADQAMPSLLGLKGKLAMLILAVSLALSGALFAAPGQPQSIPAVPQTGPPQPPASTTLKGLPAAVDLFGDPLPDGTIARLGSVRLRHGMITRSLAFAPKGRILASAGQVGFGVCIWDAASGRPLHRLATPGSCLCVAFSPDGSVLVTDLPSVIDVTTGNHLRRLEKPGPSRIFNLAVAPDGKTVAGADSAAQIVLWDFDTGKIQRRLQGHGDGIEVIAFTPDSKHVVSGSNDKTVRLWDVASGKELRRYKGPTRPVHAVALSPDGKTLAATGEDKVVWLWEVETGKSLRQLQCDEDMTYTLAFAPDGTLAAAGSSGFIRLWDPGTGRELRRWVAHNDMITSLAFAPDGKMLVSAAVWENLARWDPSTGKEIEPVPGHRGVIDCLVFANPRTLLACSRDRRVLEWDLATGRARPGPGHEPLGPPGRHPSAMDLSPDGRTLALATMDQWAPNLECALELWDVVQGKLLRTLAGQMEWVWSLRFAPDGKLLASSGKDGTRLWEVESGKELRHLAVKSIKRVTLSFSPDAKLLALALADRTVRLFEVASGKERLQWDSNQDYIRCLAFSPDAKQVASAGPDGARIWSAADGKLVWRLGGPAEPLAVAFSPSGRTLATADTDGQFLENGDYESKCTIRLWDLHCGQEIRAIAGDQGRINGLAFTPDGHALASGGGDSTILLWDLTWASKDAKSGAAELTATQLETLWSDLLGLATPADKALWQMVRSPKQALLFLKEHARPAEPADAQVIAKLVVNLDSRTFSVREKAARSLEELGESAEAPLYKVLEAKPALEVRQRIEQILHKRSADVIRRLRAIEALEHIGTPEARLVLDVIAKGTANRRISQAALAALARTK
jgi:RNA polymerase sigma factor (sigma-70 family)